MPEKTTPDNAHHDASATGTPSAQPSAAQTASAGDASPADQKDEAQPLITKSIQI